jgi:peptidoglycan hydrolase CwlO-like protein
MKNIYSLMGTIAASAIVSFSFAQEVKLDEKSVSFNNGSHNAIVVTIPYATKDVVEKELKSEMKDWGGKFESTKGEYIAMQTTMKAMGEKHFDGYAKIIESGDVIQVAFAVDLGGAYLSSSEHGAQYKVIKERAQKFGVKAANEGVAIELAAEAKILKDMEKEKSDLEKSIESSKKDIEDYKQKIAEAEQKIKDNEAALGKNGENITTQTGKIAEVEKKKKTIKS